MATETLPITKTTVAEAGETPDLVEEEERLALRRDEYLEILLSFCSPLFSA